MSSDNLLESESGYSSGSQHPQDTGRSGQPSGETEVRRSRLRKSLSSDGVISSQRPDPGPADLTDSELPELAPVVPAKSGENIFINNFLFLIIILLFQSARAPHVVMVLMILLI